MPTIAAVDPSIRSAGFAVLSEGALAHYGTTPLRTADQVTDLVDMLVEQFAPSVVALEVTFIGSNSKTGIDLSVLRGRLLQELERRRVPVVLVAPSQWRKTTIKPPAKTKRPALKKMAIAYVLEHHGIAIKEDAAEALCLALHVHKLAAATVTSPQTAPKSASPAGL